MATPNPPLDLELLDEEGYNESEDEDFDATTAADNIISSSSSDEDGNDNTSSTQHPKKKRKIEHKSHKDQEDLGELDSGDEVTIRRAKEKQQKKAKKRKRSRKADEDDDGSDGGFEDDDEEGGEGGVVRTRAMRKMERGGERKALAKAEGATVDVDELWRRMNQADPGGSGIEGLEGDSLEIEGHEEQATNGDQEGTEERNVISNGLVINGAPKPSSPHLSKPTTATTTHRGEETIKINRTYKFAGEWITEEKTVPKESAEAKLYLASQQKENTPTTGSQSSVEKEKKPPLRRPLRRYSRFDPNPPGHIKASWEKQQAATAGAESAPTGPKLTTVEKSRIDWAGFVDREGIADELDEYGRSKEGYLGRVDFLGRTEARREEERRAARLK